MDYDDMLANETARNKVLKIEPGKSILQFYDVIDGKLVPERHKSYTAGHSGRSWSLMQSRWEPNQVDTSCG